MIKKVLEGAAVFADQQRQSAIDKLVGLSIWGVIFRWALTHWVTIGIVAAVGGYYWHVQVLKDDLRALQIQQEINNLNLDLKKMEEDRVLLLKRVTDLEGSNALVKAGAQKLKKSLQGLPPDQLQKKLLDYSNRLVRERGYDK